MNTAIRLSPRVAVAMFTWSDIISRPRLPAKLQKPTCPHSQQIWLLRWKLTMFLCSESRMIQVGGMMSSWYLVVIYMYIPNTPNRCRIVCMLGKYLSRLSLKSCQCFTFVIVISCIQWCAIDLWNLYKATPNFHGPSRYVVFHNGENKCDFVRLSHVNEEIYVLKRLPRS